MTPSPPVLAALIAGLAIGLAGCAPPGPEALLKGEQLLKEGRYEEAVARLKKATELLPKNAQAWNHLGLAYHGNRQPQEAARAYQAALAQDHKLAAPHYNLGCLYLEQNNLDGATQELTTYTLVQKSHVDGWLKFGVTHLRAKRLDAAERCFRTALDLHPQDPEALNDLGVIQFQRHRWQDAHNFFNLTLTQHPGYGPAQLNIAVVNHQTLNNRPAALKQYKAFLASQPRGAEWDAVDSLARQLAEELNPPTLALRPVATNTPPPTTVRTNLVAAAPAPSRATQNPPPVVAARTNPAPVAASPRTHPGPTNRQVAAVRPTPEPPSRAVSNPPPKAVEIPATPVTDDLVLKPAQELAARSTPAPNSKGATAPPPSSSATNGAAANADAKTDSNKRSLISRLNPFSRKPKEPEPGKTSAGGTNVLLAQAAAAPVEASSTSAAGPRYPYQSMAAPRPGNRAQAQPAFDRGYRAQKAGKATQAIEEYQNALRADPAYFDACYNLGLAAQDNGNLGLALIAYETALALKSDSSDARYNFALALRDSSYPQDAADQLKKLLATSPNELRAHLSLASLGAQQLHQPALAREHYARVLELKPNHPEAVRIRAWLANNP